MADGSVGGIRKQIGGTFEDIGEAIVKPVVNEGMKAAEQGVKSVVAPQQQNQNPQQPGDNPNPQLQKQEQDGLLEARRKIQHWQTLDQGQKKVREEDKKEEAEKVQEEKQQEEVKQYKVVQKKQAEAVAVQQAKTKTETRGGVGG